ncbi:carbamoyl-phosphate synthase, small subunit [Thermosinus carboxydivorans Nor1]|uniref:Carbamoyl phosphate synthase small chain n=1 Tax=Thermosinus carboxydivorans Nor1 TaxID=401526 RepID=A1HPN0_9FIRM|nr:glutamine-hydrolyzing carbamoyl-phosphate synthase small subunit [Thermosinus carboxydivorans]EAX48000.1 carbamoyl-phosphate synthase, small subunit [Thermosinus carboxydivorans Nor1]
MEGKLVLADGSVFSGTMLGPLHTVGEVVFNTGMTGYQEVLTDPSYCGQIVTMTYPLIGNYGVAASFNQSRQPYVRGFVIGELCSTPSNWRAENSLAEFLKRHRIPCLYGVDTRALTRRIRASGVMMGVLAPARMGHEEALALLSNADVVHLVEKVTTPIVYRLPRTGPRVVVMDFGVKRNILESLARLGCDLTVVPAATTAETILAMEPDGVFLSNGPGDPKEVSYAIETVKKLVGRKPIFGICLGHQILALALGGDTYKLKFGHRGANHPVKDLATGRVFITSQNHGYAVAETSLHGTDLVVTHRAVNDGTVEGLRHRTLPVFSVQYHPEAAPGPHDNMYLFQQFYQLMTKEV